MNEGTSGGQVSTYARVSDNDTHRQALDWTANNLPQHSQILLETSTIDPDQSTFDVFLVQKDHVAPPTSKRRRLGGWSGTHAGRWKLDLTPEILVKAVRDAGVDYVFLGDWINQYNRDVAYYPRELKLYQAMEAAFPEVIRFKPEGNALGPEIRILRVPPP